MKDLISNIFEKMINEQKGLKVLAWIFIIVVILAIVLYPIIDANFLYYSRTTKRIEILQKLIDIDEKTISNDERLEKEFNNILDDMSQQSNNYINNVFIKETSGLKNFAKFISGAWLFIIVGFTLPFSIDKNNGKRFSSNNIIASIFCLLIGGIFGYICMKIPNIFNFSVNIVLNNIVLIFWGYTIANINNNS